MDFMLNALASGQRLKNLTIFYERAREAIELVVGLGTSGHYVARVLDQAARFRSYAKAMRTGQDQEFTGRAIDQSAYEHGVRLKLIQLGDPTRKACVEASIGSFAMNV